MAQELTVYIKKARDKKLTDEQIKKHLIDVGWSTEQITEALAQESELPVPPIPHMAHIGLWTGFLYSIFFISLYILSFAIGGLFNAWIDKPILNSLVSTSSGPTLNADTLADLPNIFLLNYANIGEASLLRGYVATIIVAYAVFLFLAIVLKKQLNKQPSIKNIRSRKILIYITLIGTFFFIFGDIVMGIYDYLAGSMTSLTIRHLIVTLLISGPIFVFYINEVKNDKEIT